MDKLPNGSGESEQKEFGIVRYETVRSTRLLSVFSSLCPRFEAIALKA